MSTEDELAELRARKREELLERTDGEQDGDDAGDEATPGEPVRVAGADHLQELVDAHDVVLVDFHADWCGPCQTLEPELAALAADTRTTVATVDVDAHPDLAGRYRVQGVPTMLLFVDGEPTERLVGFRDRDDLAALVDAKTAA